MVKLTEEELMAALASLPEWEITHTNGHNGLQKRFRTGDFMTGVRLINRIAEAAECLNHHPDVSLTYSSVLIRLTTHTIGDLTSKDIELARQIEQLYPRVA